MARYQDKVVIVTGGSRGIGEGCVRVFVDNGSKVVFCAPGPDEGRDLMAELNAKGPGECFYVKCDVTVESDIQNLIKATVDKYGQIDCLINNAGWHPAHKPIDGFSVDDFKSLLNLNLVSCFTTCKYAMPYLRKTKGNVINVSSLVNTLGQAGAVTYVASKGGVSALTRALAIDEAAHEVRINTLSPSCVWTPLWQENAASFPDPEKVIESGKDTQLLGRMATIIEMGKACLFLAADATFTTGHDMLATGGAELSYGFKNRLKSSNVF